MDSIVLEDGGLSNRVGIRKSLSVRHELALRQAHGERTGFLFAMNLPFDKLRANGQAFRSP
jgi:hypothetical protein